MLRSLEIGPGIFSANLLPQRYQANLLAKDVPFLVTLNRHIYISTSCVGVTREPRARDSRAKGPREYFWEALN